MSDTGVIKQIIGAVIDVEFDKAQIPNIYDALVVGENNLVLETQQQLGDGIVRTVAMGTTEGLKRGLNVENTKAPISVPVGEATLGRIMNVLGDPIDMKGEVKTKERMPIHRKPPEYVDLADSNEILETDSKTNFTIGFGAIYQYYKNNRLNYTFGISAFNLNQPNQGFYNEIIKRDIRINVFGSSTYKINYDWELIPSINLSMQGKFYEFMLGSSFRYTIVNKLGKYRAINSGLWYRHKDAGIIYLGMDYQNFLIGLSYDINFSKLTPASRNRGGFEISFRYILTHFKPKKITHRICPDFI